MKDKAKAIELLKKLQEEGNGYSKSHYNDPAFGKWLLKVKTTLENLFGAESIASKDFKMVRFLGHHGEDPDAFRDGLMRAEANIEARIHEIENFWPDTSPVVPPDAIVTLQRIFSRFHSAARQLRNRHGDRSTLTIVDEFDVQDLLHVFLKLHFDDIRPEEGTPSRAGGASRIDFLLKKERIVVEVKKTRSSLGARQIGEELIVDRERYQAHPSCDRLVCFVYDPEGIIGNPRGLENDLNKGTTPITNVFVFPDN